MYWSLSHAMRANVCMLVVAWVHTWHSWCYSAVPLLMLPGIQPSFIWERQTQPMDVTVHITIQLDYKPACTKVQLYIQIQSRSS